MSHSYARLGLALGVSLLLMFLLTMSMVRSLDHYHLNLGNFSAQAGLALPAGASASSQMPTGAPWPVSAARSASS
jgi:hypothetical protein